MSRVSFKAVIVGGVADVVATNILAIPVVVYAFIVAGIAHLPKAEQTPALMDAMQNRPGLYLLGLVLGSICSVFGGYLAARIAKHDEVLNGALSSYLCLAFGAYAMVKGTIPTAPLLHAVFLALSPALGAIGGYLRIRGARPA